MDQEPAPVKLPFMISYGTDSRGIRFDAPCLALNMPRYVNDGQIVLHFFGFPGAGSWRGMVPPSSVHGRQSVRLPIVDQLDMVGLNRYFS